EVMAPWRPCMSSRGQKTHFALQMFVLSIWTISGKRGARSRPVASSSRRTGLACLRRGASAACLARARRVGPEGILRLLVLLLAEVLDHAIQDFVELDGRRVADQCLDLGNVRYSSRHVLEPGFVRLVVGNPHDLGLAAGQRSNPFGRVAVCDLVLVAEVTDLSNGA